MSVLLNGGAVAGYTLNGSAYNSSQVEYCTGKWQLPFWESSGAPGAGKGDFELNPANNYRYEQNDGLDAVYNGPTSAVAALTPFLAPGGGAA